MIVSGAQTAFRLAVDWNQELISSLEVASSDSEKMIVFLKILIGFYLHYWL